MRFLVLFFKIFGTLSVVSALVVFGYLDGSLHLAARQVRKDMSATRLLLSKSEHAGMCNRDVEALEFTITDTDVKPFKGYRLRFVSDLEYVIEAVCTASGLGPFEVRRETLPYGVVKVAGSGVEVFGSGSGLEARVLLKKGFRYLATGYYDGELAWRYDDHEDWKDYGSYAAEATCEGWGDQCCLGQTEVGVGEARTDALDCQGECYAACKSRPYVVYFNTNPVMDRNTRVLTVEGRTVEVGFGYEVTDSDGEVTRVGLDYGDGSTDVFRAMNITTHVYECPRVECRFEAVLSARDNDGLELAETRLNALTVVVKN